MNMDAIEYWAGWAGAAGILAVIVVVLIGFSRGQRRAQGRASGAGLRFLLDPSAESQIDSEPYTPVRHRI
jgi:hypothetical protein